MLRTGTVSQGLNPQPYAITLWVFSPDASTWVPPPPDCADFDFSLGEDVAFGTCVERPQPPESLQPCWRDAAERQGQALGDALEENSQVGPGPSRHPAGDAGTSPCSSGAGAVPSAHCPLVPAAAGGSGAEAGGAGDATGEQRAAEGAGEPGSAAGHGARRECRPPTVRGAGRPGRTERAGARRCGATGRCAEASLPSGRS